MRNCGPKCSVCMLVVSGWGVLMLLLMGIFARVNAVSFAEDIPLDETDWAKRGYPAQALDDAYILLSNNCFIAAGIYGFIMIICGVQFYFHKRASHLVH
ncbi:Salivary secreted ribonuclease [Paragonimus westermani]|uniref:Salivary secreted ribonuclease n=1 Tax=Paragonimus westermani TaxID=34504 RepID=A0A8T0D1Y8_9TREM|nr:Salivary secreted ribonuclease [Paragonimus westermani]